MIKKLRVTVDGKSYEVTVEVPEEAGSPSPAPMSFTPPAAPPAAIVSTSPVAAPAANNAAAAGDVVSPLSGRIVAVLVQPGQEVKAQEHLLTVEAMKMNTSVLAPAAGKVAEIYVAVSSTVDEGQRLVRLEELKK
jgi:biotin carboxyl carrier protein